MTTSSSDLPPQHDLERGGDVRPPAGDREQVYYEGTPMLRGELGMLVLCWGLAAVLILAPILWGIFGSAWPAWWITLPSIVIGILVGLLPYLFTRTVHYRISNYRIDYERGILSKKIDTLELWHVDDISFRQSLIDRIFRVGSIIIESDDKSTPRLELHGLPQPRSIFDSLKQRIIAVKRQRGVIKMDIGQ